MGASLGDALVAVLQANARRIHALPRDPTAAVAPAFQARGRVVPDCATEECPLDAISTPDRCRIPARGGRRSLAC